jgi:hypothetical protein
LRPADLQLDLPWTSFNDGCVDQKINLLFPAKQDNCRTKAWKQSSKHVTVAKTQHSTGKHFKRTDPKPQNWSARTIQTHAPERQKNFKPAQTFLSE